MTKQPSLQCKKRLEIENKRLAEDPADFVVASPCPDNILEWFYVLEGPPGTCYEGGKYLGTVTFPSNYPFAPPAIRMLTPSGRFEPGKRLCLSISDYHPESWNPIWGMKSILMGLLSFMVGSDHTLGSIETSEEQRRALAQESHLFNIKNENFARLFPKEAEAAKKLTNHKQSTRKRDRE